MKLFLKIWRQKNPESEGKIINYEIDGITEDMSFLEMMDVPVSYTHLTLPTR